jgi:integrase/recombinase XerD
VHLDAACDLFLDHLKVERNLSPHTLEGYSRDLTKLRTFLAARGPAQAAKVQPVDVIDHLRALTEAGLGARSRARALVAIRGLFRFLVAERCIDADPTETLEAPRIGRRLPEVLGENEVERLLEAPPRISKGATCARSERDANSAWCRWATRRRSGCVSTSTSTAPAS